MPNRLIGTVVTVLVEEREKVLRVVEPITGVFLALGPVAEAFLTGAAAAGVTKLPAEITDILVLKPPTASRRCWLRWSGRWRSAGGALAMSTRSWPPTAPPRPTEPGQRFGEAVVLTLTSVPTRSLDGYALAPDGDLT